MTGTIYDWSSTAASNVTLEGININTGMSVDNTDNAIRALMAVIRNTLAANLPNFFNGTAPLPVVSGGTNATTASGARTSLGAAASGANSDITSLSGLTTPLSVAQGGSGAATAAGAFANIAVSASSIAFPIGYIKFANGMFIMWGSKTFAGGGASTTVTYNTELGITTGMATGSLAIISGGYTGDTDRNGPFVTACDSSGFTAFCRTTSNSTGFWIAIGK